MVAQAVGLSVGLCLAQCAVLCAQLLPPLTVKRVVDGGLAEAGSSIAELARMIGKVRCCRSCIAIAIGSALHCIRIVLLCVASTQR
jgi:hypothetical protein